MMKPGVYTFSKEVVNHVVEQLALHQPERKEEVVQWYRDVLSFYNSASLEDNVIDGTLLAFMAGSLVKVCGEETESIIKPLFDKGYVNLSVITSYSIHYTKLYDVHADKLRFVEMESLLLQKSLAIKRQ